MKMLKPEATLIIPTFNKAPRLRLMLMSCCGLEGKENLELLIVNDGSNDGTEDIIKEAQKKMGAVHFRLGVIKTGHKGRSYARNAGIKEALGKVLIFTDDDLLLHKGFLTSHLRGHSRGKGFVIHGRIYHIPYLKFFRNPSTGEMWDGIIREGYLADKLLKEELLGSSCLDRYLRQNIRMNKLERDIYKLYQETEDTESCYRWVGVNGGNFSVNRDEIVSCGMFDTNMGTLWGAEDLELGYRLYQWGCRFIYDISAENYHMDHYRREYRLEHQTAMAYFEKKHSDARIRNLSRYFEGKLESLMEWRNYCERMKDLR